MQNILLSLGSEKLKEYTRTSDFIEQFLKSVHIRKCTLEIRKMKEYISYSTSEMMEIFTEWKIPKKLNFDFIIINFSDQKFIWCEDFLISSNSIVPYNFSSLLLDVVSLKFIRATVLEETSRILDIGFKYNVLDTIRSINPKSHVKFDMSLILLNVEKDGNIGMILRSAEIFGVNKIYVLGSSNIQSRFSMGSNSYIQIIKIPFSNPHFDRSCFNGELVDIFNLFYEKHQEDSYFCCLEQGGTSLENISSNFFSIMKKHIYIVVGNEGFGTPKKILEKIGSENTFSITQYGFIRSLNVSIAASIFLNKIATDLARSKLNLF